MRIGIITQPLAQNYGGVVQNYALQQVLRALGHKPRTIDYLPRKHYGERFKHIIWSILHFRWPNRWYQPSLPTRYKVVKNFVRQHIATTYLVRRYRSNTVKIYGFEAIIVGSDQVWRPMYNEFLFDMYFQFSKSLSVKKIVYGASFGTSEWEYDAHQTNYCKSLLPQMTAVSVREKSGIDLCRRYFNFRPQWVLDPTLLLDKIDYERLCIKIPRHTQSFIALYLLDFNDLLIRQINDLGNQLHCSVQFFSADDKMSLSIEEWLAMFRDAKYVITDSFHGTIFSIIFNKPFIAIGNDSRGMSRFYSLLEQFNLKDHLSPEVAIDVLLQPISWSSINHRKHELKQTSIQYLESALR